MIFIALILVIHTSIIIIAVISIIRNCYCFLLVSAVIMIFITLTLKVCFLEYGLASSPKSLQKDATCIERVPTMISYYDLLGAPGLDSVQGWGHGHENFENLWAHRSTMLQVGHIGRAKATSGKERSCQVKQGLLQLGTISIVCGRRAEERALLTRFCVYLRRAFQSFANRPHR